MSILLEVCITLVVLYLLECLMAVRRDHVILWRPGWFRFRVSRARNLPGPLAKGIFASTPVPPLGPVFTTGFGSVCFSRHGVVNLSPHGPGLGEHDRETTFFTYEDIERIRSERDWVQINGQLFAAMGSECSAHHTAGFITSLRDMPEDRREEAIRKELDRWLSMTEVETQYQQIREKARALSFTSNLQFVVLFILFPLAYWLFGLRQVWLPALILVVGLWLMVIFDFRSAYRKLLPDDRSGRGHKTLIMSMTPLAGLRGYCMLTRDSLSMFSPLTVVHQLTGRDEFMALARDVYADLNYRCSLDAEQDEVISAVDWYRDAFRDSCRRLLESLDVDPEKLLGAPEKEDETVKGYCPRCHVQFEQSGQECHYCPGIDVVPFRE